MEKKKIALVAGGYSGEYVISIGTAETINQHLNRVLYDVYTILINREGWFYESAGHRVAVDRNDFSIELEGKRITFDAVFMAVHGSPGEDGRLQGYFDMLGIPYTTCSSIVSALTFNKSFCNKVVNDFNVVRIAKSVHLFKKTSYSIGAVLEQISLPVFVKPNESGSSLGISKVTNVDSLLPAIEKAFGEDNEVLVEEFIEGRELTIGVYKLKGQVFTLPPTEIVSRNEFFDYEAKYTPGVTDEITPAKIPEDILKQLRKKAQSIYTRLNCKGIVRMDFILQRQSNELYFLEVNTMPGQSENSIVPQQVRAAGMDLSRFYGDLLQEIIENAGR